ncbi:hypothetical protein ACS8YF_00310 [Salinisphaera sp. SWV1]|uniref:hypothetical protein n=1 Tax=Salinisphaera sp. SWV1 TaxID=3454139 RepID=UPI003F861EAB
MPKKPVFREPIIGSRSIDLALTEKTDKELRRIFADLPDDALESMRSCCSRAIDTFHQIAHSRNQALTEDRQGGRGEKRALAEHMAGECFKLSEKIWQSGAIGRDLRDAADSLGLHQLSLVELSSQIEELARVYSEAAVKTRLRAQDERYKTPRVQVASELALDYAAIVGEEPTFTRASREKDGEGSRYLQLVKVVLDQCESRGGAGLPMSTVENPAWDGLEDYRAGCTFQNVFDHEI